MDVIYVDPQFSDCKATFLFTFFILLINIAGTGAEKQPRVPGQIEDIFLQKFRFRNRLFVYRGLLMLDTKSRGYLNSGWLSQGEYSVLFFSTRPSPNP